MDLSNEFHPVPKPVAKTKKSSAPLASKTPINKSGKKTEEWTNAREIIKARFKSEGIVTCEIKLSGCWHINALTFAHIDKRRNLEKDDLYKVVLACTPCHQVVEAMPSKEMRRLLVSIIAVRQHI